MGSHSAWLQVIGELHLKLFYVITNIIHWNTLISDMVRTKIDFSSSKPTFSLCLPQIKLKNDKLNIAKISVSKLSKIVDPQTKLRKAVLINNTLKNLHKLSDPWIIHDSGGGGFLMEEQQNEEQNQACIKNFSNKMESEKNTLSEDMLCLYDDIINDIFGKNEKESELSEHRQEEQDKDIEFDNFKENNCLWS